MSNNGNTQVNSPPQEKSSSGVPGLDSVMAGGYPAKHMFLVEGDPGTGKTTFGLQFLLEGVRLGERGLVCHSVGERR